MDESVWVTVCSLTARLFLTGALPLRGIEPGRFRDSTVYKCSGTEASLDECATTIDTVNCRRTAGVECIPPESEFYEKIHSCGGGGVTTNVTCIFPELSSQSSVTMTQINFSSVQVVGTLRTVEDWRCVWMVGS